MSLRIGVRPRANGLMVELTPVGALLPDAVEVLVSTSHLLLTPRSAAAATELIDALATVRERLALAEALRPESFGDVEQLAAGEEPS